MASYLEHPLPLTLVENARQHTTWFAKVFDGRPQDLADRITEIPAIQNAFQKAVDTRSKPFESITLLFDSEGAFLLVTYKGPVAGSIPKGTTTTLLSTLLPKPMLDTVLDDLKPLDELDKERITAMRTLADYAPPPPPPTQQKEADTATLDLLQSTGTSLTEKIAAFFVEPGNTLALPTSGGPTTLATRQKEQSKFWILLAWGRMVLSKIGTPEDSGDDLTWFGQRTRCWETWNSLRAQRNHLLEETLDEVDSSLQLQAANLKADAAFYQEAMKEPAALIVASAGLVRLTYRRCYLTHRRELLILKRLSQTPTLVELFRVVSTMIEAELLPTPATNKQRSDLKLFCLNLLRKANPSANTETLTISERLTIAISLGRESHLCPCGKPGKLAFPKASWDWHDDDEVEDFSYEAFCSKGCLKHYRPRYCPKCFRSDQLSDVQSTLLPYAATPQPILRCLRCGVYETHAGHPDDTAIALHEKKRWISSMPRPPAHCSERE